MALVAYDYESNSDSDNEDSEQQSGSSVVIVNNNANSQNKGNRTEFEVHSNASGFQQTVSESATSTEFDEPFVKKSTILFSTLPPTKSQPKGIEEDQIEDFIPRPKPVKEKQKVKISIPSLSQFDDDDEEPEAKKQKHSVKGCGLMAILPPVKGSVLTVKSFIPNVVNKNKNSTNTSKTNSSCLVPNVLRKKAEVRKAELVKKLAKTSKSNVSDLESDEEMDIPETFDEEMWEKVCGRPKLKPAIIEPEEPVLEVIDIAPEPTKPYDGLDNKAFKELVGKTKRPIGNIKLIDINEEEILPDKDLWMTKSLTDPGMVPKAQIEDPVDPTRRKKHHITYLAQQAKANEQELQAAWSASKNNRMASRAKYGF